MFEVYKTPDTLDQFIYLCDEQKEEINKDARRHLYKERDFSCSNCLYHIVLIVTIIKSNYDSTHLYYFLNRVFRNGTLF